jgi:hypothetical protein
MEVLHMTRLSIILILLAGCQSLQVDPIQDGYAVHVRVPIPVEPVRMGHIPSHVVQVSSFADCMAGPDVEVSGPCTAYDYNTFIDRRIDLSDYMRLTARTYSAPITGWVTTHEAGAYVGVYAGLTLQGEIVDVTPVPSTEQFAFRIDVIRASASSTPWRGSPMFWTAAQWAEISGE